MWQLASQLGEATPPDLWRLMRLEDAPEGGGLPEGGRAQLKHLEGRMFDLEERLQAPLRAS